MEKNDDVSLVPGKGFYYHFKRSSGQSANKHAYEVLKLCIHTESDELLIAYRPLYGNTYEYRVGNVVDVRPVQMFMEKLEIRGRIVPRFERITDPETIKELEEVRNLLYPAVPE